MAKILVECWEKCTPMEWQQLPRKQGLVYDHKAERMRLPQMIIDASDGLEAARTAAATFGYVGEEWLSTGANKGCPFVVIRCTDTTALETGKYGSQS